MKRIAILFLICAAAVAAPCAFGAGSCRELPVEIIRMSDFGLSAESCGDAAAKITRALEYGKKLGKPFEIQFEKGTYHLDLYDPKAPESTSDCYAFDLSDCHDVTIDGVGSEFIFKGIAGFVMMRRSSNIEIRNLSVDWDRPYITQAEIRACGPDYMDLAIDREQYPYVIEGGKAKYLCAEGAFGVAKYTYCNYFSADGRILPGHCDNYWMENLLNGPAEEIDEGVIRFHGKVEVPAPAGTIVTIYNARYRTSWAMVLESEDIVIRDVTIHHSTGCGLYAALVRNLTLDNFDFVPRRDKGRVFTTVADAVHVANCSGQIIMRNCDIDGQGDDALNVHGRYCRIYDRMPDGKSFQVQTYNSISYLKAGDRIWFIDKNTLTRSREYTIKSSKTLGASKLLISLTETPDIDTQSHCFIESASAIPDVLVENNRFGAGNRARGILLTSSGKMIVRNNVFRSAGTAILVEGDLSYWYESGAVRDLSITGNVFDCCHTSQWGRSVISITPSPVPDDDSLPRYHSGINISGNSFRLIEASVLYATYTDKLSFVDNDISIVGGFPAIGNMPGPVVLEHCSNCTVQPVD